MSFAYTGPSGEGYPAYVNISAISPSGDIKVIVRGAPKRGAGGHLECGPYAECVVPASEWPSLPANEAMVRYMVNRFLGWCLPDNFSPDGGISFEPIGNKGSTYEYCHKPVGTNLLNADQADAMVRHMLEGLPDA